MYLANRVNTAERQIDRLQFDVRAVDNAVDVFAAERGPGSEIARGGCLRTGPVVARPDSEFSGQR